MLGGYVYTDDKAPVEAAVKSLKTALEQNDQDAIRKGVEELVKAQHKIAEVLYRQSQAAPGGHAAPGHDGAEQARGAGASGGGSAAGNGDVFAAGHRAPGDRSAHREPFASAR